MYLMAHRGGSMENPENTLQAFIHSHKIGVDVIETDVRITKDGKILVCHDQDFSRLTKTKKKVIETLSSDLPNFKDELPMHFSNKSLYKRLASDTNSYTLLEDVFIKLPKS